MSALFGVLDAQGAPIPSGDLEAMRQALAYWGVDGQRVLSLGSVGFGHARVIGTPEDARRSAVLPRKPGGRARKSRGRGGLRRPSA